MSKGMSTDSLVPTDQLEKKVLRKNLVKCAHACTNK
jgi:hypothetical protein